MKLRFKLGTSRRLVSSVNAMPTCCASSTYHAAVRSRYLYPHQHFLLPSSLFSHSLNKTLRTSVSVTHARPEFTNSVVNWCKLLSILCTGGECIPLLPFPQCLGTNQSHAPDNRTSVPMTTLAWLWAYSPTLVSWTKMRCFTCRPYIYLHLRYVRNFVLTLYTRTFSLNTNNLWKVQRMNLLLI